MADETKMISAKNTYNALCKALDNRGWKYTKHEDDLVVSFGVSGDDLPMDIVMMVDAERQVVRLLSRMNFKMTEEKRVDGALAVCIANYGMVDGCFDYDVSDGAITFRIVSSFRDTTLGDELLQYMISCACAMIDGYNDKFLAISKGLMSIEDFIAKEN